MEFVEFDVHSYTAALSCTFVSCMVDQNLVHRSRRGSEELLTYIDRKRFTYRKKFMRTSRIRFLIVAKSIVLLTAAMWLPGVCLRTLPAQDKPVVKDLTPDEQQDHGGDQFAHRDRRHRLFSFG